MSDGTSKTRVVKWSPSWALLLLSNEDRLGVWVAVLWKTVFLFCWVFKTFLIYY